MMDRGPWTLFYSAPPERRLVGVSSEDFEYDVTLRVTGDFGMEELKQQYCEWLIRVLNETVVRERELRRQALDDLVRLSEELGLYETTALKNPLICRHDDRAYCTKECRAKALALEIIRTLKPCSP